MAFHQINGIKIRTTFDYPPIPVRSFDWSAIDEDTYDCDCDEAGFFSTSPIGHGATEQDAIDDLLEQIEDNCAADSYGELEITCSECDGEGCDACSGCGTVWIEARPVTLDDLDQIGAA